MGKIIDRIRARELDKLTASLIAEISADAAIIAEMDRRDAKDRARKEALSWPSLQAERGEFIMPSYADWKF